MCKIKRAILIAAGEGSRLRPVTCDTPKPLVKVNGKRIMDMSIEALTANGIEDIYIVVGYKKEQFYELYGQDPRLHLVENHDYLKGNNITSMYLVRDYLPEAFVLEADIVINNPDILNPRISKSGYLASWREPANEWRLEVEDNRITSCEINSDRDGFQLWGISMWTKDDGERLATKIKAEYEQNNRSVYWDELALMKYKTDFDLGIREVAADDLLEIDTFEELVMIDNSYKDYKREGE